MVDSVYMCGYTVYKDIHSIQSIYGLRGAIRDEHMERRMVFNKA